MGLIIAAFMAALIWIALWRTRKVTGAALQLLGAALLTGLAGYAFQGRVGLAGSPAAEQRATALPPAMPIALANEFFGQFNGASSWLIIANSFLAKGDSGEAVATLESAIRSRPNDAQLWIGLGNALTIHNGGRISPAARLAYGRSTKLAPDHPGPAFFFGLALLQQNDVPGGLVVWRQLLTTAPPGAPWGSALAARIALVERLQRDTAASSRSGR